MCLRTAIRTSFVRDLSFEYIDFLAQSSVLVESGNAQLGQKHSQRALLNYGKVYFVPLLRTNGEHDVENMAILRMFIAMTCLKN